jgi:macrolide-specific efflux system membrane fusion protein
MTSAVKPNPKKKWMIIGGVIVILVAGFFIWRANSTPKTTYQEFTIQRGDLANTILSTGTVQPENRLEIKPPVAGRIDQVLIKEGQKVAKGQILAWMSSTERAALLDAARSQSEDEVKKWEDLYRPTPVLAPLSGTIILRSIESGQTVTNTDAILVMSDRLIVKAQVDETDMAQVKLKQRAEIILDAYSAEKTEAKVDQIAFEAKTTNNVTTYDVDVLPDKTPPFMRAGMTANVTFYIDSRKDTLLIPTEAIVYKKNAPQALVKDPAHPSESPRAQDLKLGLSDGKQSEVLEGLKEGDVVMVPKLVSSGKSKPASPFGPTKVGGRKK